MRITATLLIFFGLFTPVLAQNPKIDSLENLLRQARPDTLQVILLNDLCIEYWSTQPEKTLTYAQEAISLARKLNYRRGEARSYQCLGVYYWQKNDHAKAIASYSHAQQIYGEIHDQRGAAKSLINLGLVYMNQGNDVRALENFLAALKVFRTLGDKDVEASILNSIGIIYKDRQDAEEAVSFFQQALGIWKKMGRQQAIAGVLSNISEVYVNQKAYDNALRYNEQALRVFESLEDLNGQIICQNNSGNVYLKKNDPATALVRFRAALQLNESYQGKGLLASSHNGMGAVYAQMGEYPKALEHYRQAYELAQDKGLKDALQKSSAGLASVYARNKDYESAFRFLNQSTTLKDSSFSEESTTRIAKLRANYENEKKQIEIDLLQKEKALAQSTRNLIAMGMGALLIIALLTLNQQRQKVRKNNELLVKNQQLYQSQQALAEAQQYNSQIREKQLQEELEFRSKSLTTHTLNLIQKNGVMEEIRETVAEVLKSPRKDEHAPIYHRLMKLVDYSFSLDKDWDDFKMYFEQVHREFFIKLKDSHADLSTGELKLCALIKLNMNLKEAATVMGISPESVKTARYRLRKKLNLEEEKNLADYLMSL